MEHRKRTQRRKFKVSDGVPPPSEKPARGDRGQNSRQHIGDAALVLILIFSLGSNVYQNLLYQDVVSVSTLMQVSLRTAEAKVFKLNGVIGMLQLRNGDLLRSDSVHREKNEQLSRKYTELLISNKAVSAENIRITNALNIAERDNIRLKAANLLSSYLARVATPVREDSTLDDEPGTLSRIRLNEPPGGSPQGNPVLASQVLPLSRRPISSSAGPRQSTVSRPWWAGFSLPQVFFLSCTLACVPVFFHSMWRERREQRNRFRPGSRR